MRTEKLPMGVFASLPNPIVLPQLLEARLSCACGSLYKGQQAALTICLLYKNVCEAHLWECIPFFNLGNPVFTLLEVSI